MSLWTYLIGIITAYGGLAVPTWQGKYIPPEQMEKQIRDTIDALKPKEIANDLHYTIYTELEKLRIDKDTNDVLPSEYEALKAQEFIEYISYLKITFDEISIQYWGTDDDLNKLKEWIEKITDALDSKFGFTPAHGAVAIYTSEEKELKIFGGYYVEWDWITIQ